MGIAIFFGVIAIIFGGISLAINISIKHSEKQERLEQERIDAENRKQMLHELENGTWEFPTYELEVDFEESGILYPVADSKVQEANEIILSCLAASGVPAKYHPSFIGKERINEYLLKIYQDEHNRIIEILQTISKQQSFTSITSEASFQKAKIIMENALAEDQVSPTRRAIYMERDKIISCFDEVEKRNQSQKERKLQRELKQLRKEEAEYDKICRQGIEYSGKEKTIQYCLAQIATCQQEIQQCKDELDGKADETAARSMQYDQINNNWASVGGAASAVAGPVAGAVIAADHKKRIDDRNRKNAELSQINLQLFMLQAQEIKSRQARAESQLKQWEKTLQAAKFALEEKQNPDYLLTQINPSVESCIVTKTGAVKLKISFSTTPDLKVFGEKPAFVDGSVVVKIKDGEKTVGSTVCCLPFKGTTKAGRGECICTETTTPDGQYQIEFAPYKLWAMEKI